LARQPAGVVADLLGPLGRGFTIPADPAVLPVIVAGGYGCAATYLLARRCAAGRPPVCLFGARTRDDLLLVAEFQALGCDVRIATDDGSAGRAGFVTLLLAELLDTPGAGPFSIHACGPNPMLKAVTGLVLARGLDAEISLDHAMCCGVGACFACVVKRKAANADGWEYSRTCIDGPVFPASETVWD
jgi:dihydroorotate dehydrogenase electron transfer subunit